jgi:Transcription initiation factor IID, 18kD subunit
MLWLKHYNQSINRRADTRAADSSASLSFHLKYEKLLRSANTRSKMAESTLTGPATESLLQGLAGSSESTQSADIVDVLHTRPPSQKVHSHSARLSTEDADDESEDIFKERLMDWFEQMMFVSGETAEPSAETTGMIEELVRQQVIEMVSRISLDLSKMLGLFPLRDQFYEEKLTRSSLPRPRL